MKPHMTAKEKLLYYFLIMIDTLKKVWQFLFTQTDTSPYSGRYLTRREQLKLLSENNSGIVVNGRLRLDAEKEWHGIAV